VGFLDSPERLAAVLEAHPRQPARDLNTLLAADRWARQWVRASIDRLQPDAAAG
jgi:1-deoxy-D-xylulose 5-phosphate reductoisomerase